MYKNVGVAHLIERSLERLHQVGGQLAYESHSVGEQEWQVFYHDLATSGVERSKKLVLGKHFALAKQVHKRGLSHIRIAHKGYSRELAAILALNGLLLVESAQALLQERDFVKNNSAVGLNLRFTRSAHTYTTTLALEVSPHSRESRQKILILRQLHLHLCIGSLRTLGKNIENKAGAVEHLHFHLLLNVGNLLWGEVIVENHQPHLIFLNILRYLLKFALSHKCHAVGRVHALQEFLHRLRSCGVGQESKLIEIFISLCFILRRSDKPH